MAPLAGASSKGRNLAALLDHDRMALDHLRQCPLQVRRQLLDHDDDRRFAVFVTDADPGDARDRHQPLLMTIECLLNVHFTQLQTPKYGDAADMAHRIARCWPIRPQY